MTQHSPLTGISSMATRLVLADLVQAWQAQGGAPVQIESVGGVEAARRVTEGEAFDLVILADDALAKLASAGHVDLATRVDLARSAIAFAVRAGTPHPDLSRDEAVRAAVLAARRVGYSTGPSGTHLSKLLERWGIAQEMASRLVQARPGVPVASLVAQGEVDLGLQQVSELVNVDGVEIVAALPATVQRVTTFSAACAATSPEARRALAAAFLAFAAAPANDAIRERHGMEAPLRA
ncbi:substrate-binding domain-containing protein [Paraburkholderia acidisoli]|uniref:Solute-binding protein n=1 Tax=Paraburkholderia acidisoli TaxID=2571748 RepID=A0A7Z2JJF3_9BURK|nr:substrate-binding domain-containing protein [Paraburkholderia acidisoli]QGZ65315.1 solute-binding protein [Paraburkholderia acidisoli]